MTDPKSSQLVQIEIHVSQMDRSLAFYHKVFGWPSVPAEIQNYVILDVPRDCPWGISLVPSKSHVTACTSVILYFSAEDAEEIATLAVRFGGTKKFGPAHLPAYGSIWQITDPDGHRFGLFQRGKQEIRRPVSQ